ncbi:AAA family ATPase [Ectopseudomonas mendocina]|uniref:AAA family ATPase n=1 Tax=Ectopseudomonas mendocina TaxID=300 RepID=UPI000206DC8A|nr:DUF3696 domain-containing protein [Pseudomonas mendocina]AEB58629.1 hypothetical protein MDS_2598 [Pseudomonas mendocina NK-01]
MLTNLRLKNFKSIDMDVPIGLTNYSVLCGANSSGKSSLIQAILLLGQTFGSRIPSDSVVLNGHLIRLGGFQDIKKHGVGDDKVTIGFSITTQASNALNISFEMVFGRLSKQKVKQEDDYHPALLEVKCEVITKIDGLEYRDFVHVREPQPNDDINPYYFFVEAFDMSRDSRLRKEFPGYNIIGCRKMGIVPSVFIIEYDKTKKLSHHVISFVVGDKVHGGRVRELGLREEDFTLPKCFFVKLREVIEQELEDIKSSLEVPREIHELINSGKVKNVTLGEIKRHMVEASFSLWPEIIIEDFFFTDSTPLSDWRMFVNGLDEKHKKHLKDLVDKYRVELQEAWYQGSEKTFERDMYESPILAEVNSIFSRYFSRSVKYLGPLRNEPQAVYNSIGYLDPNTVGLKGEYTAATLHFHKDRHIEYYVPSEVSGEFSFSKDGGSVKEACRIWLSYLGVVEEFHTRDKGKLGYELHVKTAEGEEWQDLTHVGVGVSQVLPIVLMFLLSREGDVLVFEQPELHLHPKIQSRLCDLFLVLASTGRQCIIETHSEYLINRLRLRIAQDSDDTVINNSSIYFIGKEGGRSHFENVRINKYGAIKEWPKDFFDQTDREVERILIEASKKVKREKEKEKQKNAPSN